MADQPKKPLTQQQQYQADQAKAAAEHARKTQAEMQAKQLVTPAAPLEPIPAASPTRLSWHEHAERYLEDKNWERSGVNSRGQVMWNDPKGNTGREEKKFVRRLPGEQGEVDLHQLVIPPRRWDYCTEEAYGIQRDRDRAVGAPVPRPVNQATPAAVT